MKLSSDIIHSELALFYDHEIYGPKAEDLSIGAPEFYMEEDEGLLSGHLYLATVEHLAPRPRIQKGSMLVCIGDGMVLNYYKERTSLIVIRKKADFFKVFSVLQNIFKKYDEWESRLYQDLISGADLKSMIEDSMAIFERPLYVLDHSFHFVASTGAMQDTDWMNPGTGMLNPESLSKFLRASELLMEEREPMVLNFYDKPTLCVNLFGRDGSYQGCLCVDIASDKLQKGEAKLAKSLGSFIELAIERSPVVHGGAQGSIKKLLQSLLDEQPLSSSQRVMLQSINKTASYKCVILRSSERYQQLPLSYICDIAEESFEGSRAFTKDDDIVLIIDTAGSDTRSFNLELTKKLREFCSKMHLFCGISNDFEDLFNIRIHFRQALSAMEDGRMLNSSDTVFFFSSYALTEMIINSLGGLPAEAYFPDGFRAVLEHDKNSAVSYLDTIRMVLEENLNYTAASQRLFIHRSTLIDRIERIEEELGIDLKNPEQRLQIEILLKAMDLESVMRGYQK